MRENLPIDSNFFPLSMSTAMRPVAAFLRVKGDGCLKLSVHPPRHLRIHPSGSITNLEIKDFGMLDLELWPRRGRVLGWNDPAFPCARAPNRVSGVVPAHTYALKASRLHTLNHQCSHSSKSFSLAASAKIPFVGQPVSCCADATDSVRITRART